MLTGYRMKYQFVLFNDFNRVDLTVIDNKIQILKNIYLLKSEIRFPGNQIKNDSLICYGFVASMHTQSSSFI